MTKYIQSKTVVKKSNGELVQHGNCVQTAIACLLDISPSEVPNIETLYYCDEWWKVVDYVIDNFLKSQGYKRNQVSRKDLPEDEYYLVYGVTPRGSSHACIYINGMLAHDPHPTQEGLVEERDFYVLEKIKLQDEKAD